jgi:hypothetical protein
MTTIGSGESTVSLFVVTDWTNRMLAWEVCCVTANSTPSSNDLVTHKLLGIPYVRCLEMSSDPLNTILCFPTTVCKDLISMK